MIISEYYSDDGSRSAVVVKQENVYIVVYANEGIISEERFNHLTLAEDKAEDWVL